MLAEIENGLVDLIRQSALGPRLRMVDTLPDLEGDSLVGRFLVDAPGVYVAMGSFPISGAYIRPKYGIACVARNSRSQSAARHGDGITIGLYEILEAVMSIVDGADVAAGDSSVSFDLLSVDLVTSEALYAKGLYAGIVQIQSAGEVPLPGPADLSDFKTFNADYDLVGRSGAEHDKWLGEPADHSTSTPDMSDNLKLQE